MEIFLVLTFLFAIGAVGGWCVELVFRRIVYKKWINPGFLQGPYLPIYGFGVVALYLIAELPLPIENVWLLRVVQILIVCVGMTAIEYVSGIVFIKGMGIKLWDYSDQKGNVQGIICPLFSLIWTAVGAVYVILVHPFVADVVLWFTGNLYYSFFVGLLFGLLISDLAVTFKMADKLRRIAKEEKIVVKYEELKLKVRGYFEEKKLKYHFLFPWRNASEHLKRWLKKRTEAGEQEETKTAENSDEP